MKAVGITAFGGRDRLEQLDLPTPEAGAGEVRVRVAAAGVNPVDYKIREGYLTEMLPHEFPVVLGWDCAGVIDAVEINLSSIESENLFQNAKEVTLTGHYFWPGVLVWNKAKFDALPDDIQKALVEAGHETIAKQYAFVKEDEARVAKALQEKGVTINELEGLEAMRAKTAPVVEEWSGKDPIIGEFIEVIRKGS